MPSQPIAVVGLGGVFPGAPTPLSFWKNVLQGKDLSKEVPPERWVVDPNWAHSNKSADRVASKRACLIDDFNFSTQGLHLDLDPAILDPLYLLALEAGRQAVEDTKSTNFDRAKTGVILASIALPTDGSSALSQQLFANTLEHNLRGRQSQGQPTTDAHNRLVVGLPAAIVARGLGLGGGTLTLDAACASSLYAVKLACDELVSGRADAMLAGGVSRPDCLYTQMGFTALGALSPTGRCSPFDRKGDGLVVGEGAGILLLKRLQDAIEQEDHIYGVIRGIGLSNDVGGSLLAPDPEGQLRAMRAAYQAAGWKPQQVDLVECHGTGTPMGDRIEVESLNKLWEGLEFKPGQCTIGSVKSMIGHLLTGAGAAGMIKMLYALNEGVLPPTANFESPGPGISLEGSPFQVLAQSTPWPERKESRKAAVSAFGFGGINGHVLLEQWQAPKKAARSKTQTPPKGESIPIAVVGLSTRFGEVRDHRAFTEIMFSGNSAARPMPEERWNGNEETLGLPQLHGSFIEKLDIPVGKFRLPPRDVPGTLSQQLLMLEVAAVATEQAGLSRGQQKLRSGAIIGISLDPETTNFHLRWGLQRLLQEWGERPSEAIAEQLRDSAAPPLDATRTLGALGSIVASRVARELALGGPSFAVSSGDSSGLKAVELAMRSLQNREMDSCVVGAVDLAADPRAIWAADQLRPFSREAHAYPFDRRAAGPLVGEGAVALVLKRLEDAQRDGDKVLAVIRGVGSAHGEDAYFRALEHAYEDAGLDPRSVSYVEAHASGSPSEDRRESEALRRFFKGDRGIAVGATVPLVGLTGAVSGLASAAKAITCLQEELLAPLPGFEEPADDWSASSFYFPHRATPWLRNRIDGPRRAGVSSMALDGNVVHLVLEQPEPASGNRAPAGELPAAIFIADRDDLEVLAGLADKSQARTVQQRAREWFAKNRPVQHPVALVARNLPELELALREARNAVARGERRLGQAGVFYNPVPLEGQVAFVYPGSGNHYLGMSHGLAVAFPEVMRELDRTTERLRDHLMPELLLPQRQNFKADWAETALRAVEDDPHATIFGQVMAGVIATRVVELFGLKPQAVIGYSLGETAGFFSSRAWTERDAMFTKTVTSSLFTEQLGGDCLAARQVYQSDAFEWVVAVVNRPADQVRQVLEEFPKVDLLIVNTPKECVIGGEGSQVRRAMEKLKSDSFLLKGVPTVHCALLEPVKKEYYDLHLQPTSEVSGVRFYSGNWAKAYELNAESAASSITDNARSGIDYPATIEAAYADGVRIFLEMGPQGSCSRMIEQILGERPHLARSLSLAGEAEPLSLLKLLAAAAAEKVEVDLSVLYSNNNDAAGSREFPGSVEVRPGQDLPRLLENPLQPPATANGAPKYQAQSPAPSRPQPSAATAAASTATTPTATVQAVAAPSRPALAVPSLEAVPMAGLGELEQELMRTSAATAAAHRSFLELSQRSMQSMAETMQLQQQLLEQMLEGNVTLEFPAPAAPAAEPYMRRRPYRENVAFDRDACMEFAVGSIAKVLGPMFAEVDSYPVRVRLPDEPLMLCDRILEVEGEPGSLTHGRLVTEHDVFHDAWYLDAGRTPVCISVEAGQADLFLCSYLGIDLAVKGKRAYRLLDATVQFHRGLPQPGETILYDIRIEKFVRQNDVYLFFFEFDGSIDGQPLITMRNGCAGFFTEAEIKNSGGIILTPEERQPASGKRQADWRPLAPLAGQESYDDAQVEAFRRGDPGSCFGPAFADLPLQQPYGLPSGRLKLFDRVLNLDPNGGRFGLGTISAEADIHPDDWFLTCHFVDDMVMPGTLMYECCAHTLRFLLARIGFMAERSQVAFEPVLQTPAALKCRGPVTVDTKKVVYSVDIKEIGYRPEPYAIADAIMYGDGEPIVRFVDMSMQLTGVTRDQVEALWQTPLQATSHAYNRPVLYDKQSIMEFSNGRPSLAFGEPYKVFDSERRIARLPGPPYQFMDRVVEVNQEPFVLQPGGWVEVHYDIPPHEWYFGANRQDSMAYCIFLEAALQPCGWLAAYVGSALHSKEDLHFRNLGGTATLHREFYADTGTMRMRTRMTDVNEAGGMIIENFDMEIWVGDELYYEGTTYFGFFSAAALANQVGVRDAGERRIRPAEQGQSFPLERLHPLAPDDTQVEPWSGLALPGKALLMMDQVENYLPQGGSKGLGFIRGTKTVDPNEWFFTAHFYQDPVWPGSLGLEALLQLLKVVAMDRWPQLRQSHRFEPILVGEPHTWIYRGQVIRKNKHVAVEADITEVRDGEAPVLKADGFLIVDDLVIYEMKDFAIRLTPY